jgi:sulfate/thiosulfate transport system permease protein
MVGVALLYVATLLVAPLVGITYYGLKAGLGTIGDTFQQTDVRHAFYLTFVIMAITVVVNTVFGVVVALVLTRDRFPGKRLMSALVDLPLAVSPVIVGLMAILLFGRGGWFEAFFAAQGIQIIFALPSMVLVTIFISIPFVIREVVPVLEELGTEEEQAAWTLAASRCPTSAGGSCTGSPSQPPVPSARSARSSS